MRLYRFLFILSLCCWASAVKAQIPQESSSTPDQWQLTLDVIKNKAQNLMVENNGLEDEYQQLLDQVQKLRRSISGQQNTNDQISRFLQERHNTTDQQLRIEELTQIVNKKKLELKSLDEQSGNLNEKQEQMDRKIQLLQEKIANIKFYQQDKEQKSTVVQEVTSSPGEDQLTDLRKQLEDETKQEVILENQLGSLKNGDKTQNLNVDAINEENKKLADRLDELRLQKLQYEKKSSDIQLEETNGRMYNDLKRRKDQLEININAYELRLDELRESSLAALSWTSKKKELIHDMVLADARNNRIRDQIKVLREDIGVLKDQVAKLEIRVDFIKGKPLAQ